MKERFLQMNNYDILKCAEILNDAEHAGSETDKLTDEYPGMTVNEAYEIQRALADIKLQENHSICGLKMGLTSKAKMKQMNVSDPIYGYLLSYMQINDGGILNYSELIHPKAEPEIAFIMGSDLSGDNLSIADVMDAVEYITPAMEIIDSRYRDFIFEANDVIADNTSASRFVLSNKLTKPGDLRLDLLGAVMYINGVIADHGVGAAVLDHPANAVVLLLKMLSERGEGIKAGQIILTGGLTNAHSFSRNDVVSVDIEQLGKVSVSVF